MSKIFYLMGKSSTGKDTIFKMLKEDFPELKVIVQYTTRPIREGETDGEEYYFVSEKKLKSLTEQGQVIEVRTYTTKHGPWSYFTVHDEQFAGEEDILQQGTLESYMEIRKFLGKERMMPIYVEVEDGERLSRALLRERQQKEPKYPEMCRRYLADNEDFSEEKLAQGEITKRFENKEIEQCMKEIRRYIIDNRTKV